MVALLLTPFTSMIQVKLSHTAQFYNIALINRLEVSGKWTNGTPCPFKPRFFHTSVVHDNKMFVFGGALDHDGNTTDELLAYDLSKCTPCGDTTQPLTSSTITITVTPSPSYHHPHHYRHHRRLTTNIASEQYTWEQISGGGEIPSGRLGHSAVVHGAAMYVFGGFTGELPLQDIVLYSFGTLMTVMAVMAVMVMAVMVMAMAVMAVMVIGRDGDGGDGDGDGRDGRDGDVMALKVMMMVSMVMGW